MGFLSGNGGTPDMSGTDAYTPPTTPKVAPAPPPPPTPASTIITNQFQQLLGRSPTSQEVANYTQYYQNNNDPTGVANAIKNTAEYKNYTSPPTFYGTQLNKDGTTQNVYKNYAGQIVNSADWRTAQPVNTTQGMIIPTPKPIDGVTPIVAPGYMTVVAGQPTYKNVTPDQAQYSWQTRQPITTAAQLPNFNAGQPTAPTFGAPTSAVGGLEHLDVNAFIKAQQNNNIDNLANGRQITGTTPVNLSTTEWNPQQVDVTKVPSYTPIVGKNNDVGQAQPKQQLLFKDSSGNMLPTTINQEQLTGMTPLYDANTQKRYYLNPANGMIYDNNGSSIQPSSNLQLTSMPRNIATPTPTTQPVATTPTQLPTSVPTTIKPVSTPIGATPTPQPTTTMAPSSSSTAPKGGAAPTPTQTPQPVAVTPTPQPTTPVATPTVTPGLTTTVAPPPVQALQTPQGLPTDVQSYWNPGGNNAWYYSPSTKTWYMGGVKTTSQMTPEVAQSVMKFQPVAAGSTLPTTSTLMYNTSTGSQVYFDSSTGKYYNPLGGVITPQSGNYISAPTISNYSGGFSSAPMFNATGDAIWRENNGNWVNQQGLPVTNFGGYTYGGMNTAATIKPVAPTTTTTATTAPIVTK